MKLWWQDEGMIAALSMVRSPSSPSSTNRDARHRVGMVGVRNFTVGRRFIELDTRGNKQSKVEHPPPSKSFPLTEQHACGWFCVTPPGGALNQMLSDVSMLPSPKTPDMPGRVVVRCGRHLFPSPGIAGHIVTCLSITTPHVTASPRVPPGTSTWAITRRSSRLSSHRRTRWCGLTECRQA
eukprot:Selendium_serpulae@DN10151_c0_g1_i1.p1